MTMMMMWLFCFSCLLLHRTAGDTERRYHVRYYKTCPCVYETDSKGNCSKNGPHCAFAHGHVDLRKPIYDVREMEGGGGGVAGGPTSVMETPLCASLESDRLLNEDPAWNGTFSTTSVYDSVLLVCTCVSATLPPPLFSTLPPHVQGSRWRPCLPPP